MKAVRIHQPGAPEVLRYEEVADPKCGPGQALIDIHAIGVNFADVYRRRTASPIDLPTIIGQEAAGIVTAVGDEVAEVHVGDIVTYCGAPGAYAEKAAVPSHRLVSLPKGIDAQMGAAAILQGMTAHYLVHSTYPLKKGDTCLIHAGAGGMGLLLIQMAKRLGATVITTVSTDAKAEIARGTGADTVINYSDQDFEVETKSATAGNGVQVVYDAVGKTTFEKSIACLAQRGMLALYGQASGPVPPIDLTVLGNRSLFLTRPGLPAYTSTREELLWRANEVLGWVASGQLTLHIGQTFPLAEAAEAHRRLEGRETTGKVLLRP